MKDASGVPSVRVERVVTDALTTPDEALRLLFAGPTPDEAKKGARTFSQLSILGSSYLGVNVANGTAVVNFKPAALTSLNSAAAMQAMVKNPIERTLRQFIDIQRVEYAIDGKIFEQWDA